jgi:hypothetical protein
MITSSLQTAGRLSRVLVENHGRPVATADVVDDGAVVHMRFGIDHGHLPMQVRPRLVDAAFDLPVLKKTRAVQATLPLGDIELLAGLRRHCVHVDTRAAGASCLVDAMTEP